MDWRPLLAAPPVVVVHAALAAAAIFVGLMQFALPKGTLRHRSVGYVWVALMTCVALGSFAIRSLRPGRFSFVHVISAATLIGLAVAVMHARRHRAARHGWTMIGLFVGALVIAGAFTLMPGRIMHDVVFGALQAQVMLGAPSCG